jgi:Domain of unknown function (DUF222)/HNH endonuclease
MGLSDLADAVDAVAAMDPRELAGAPSIEELHRQVERLEAVLTRASAAFDASGDWAGDGARNAAAWISTRCRLPKAQVRRRLRIGRRLTELPACARAWLSGEISGAHAGVITGLAHGSVADLLRRDEQLLIRHATTLRFDQFCRALSYWRSLADPDGAEEDHAARRARRDVYLEASFQGMWFGKITLDPVAGAIVAGELERLELAEFDADRAEAFERLGHDPSPGDLLRTPGQRRADALVQMATRSRTAPADGRRPVPLFSVFVGYETLHGRICELAQGMAVAPGALVPWLEEADVERAVFNPARRIEIGATARLFTGATRRAILLRDRECCHPYCDRPGHACQVDHVVPYAVGGETTQENGRLLCPFHNRLRNARPPPD